MTRYEQARPKTELDRELERLARGFAELGDAMPTYSARDLRDRKMMARSKAMLPRSHADPGEYGVMGCALLVVPLVVLTLLVGLILVALAVASVAMGGMT